MRKQILYFFLSVSFIAFISSCNNKPSGEAYTLKMRLAPGDSFKQDMDMLMTTNVETMGFKVENEMGMKMLMNFEVLGDTAGLKKIRMTYEDAKMSMKLKGVPGADEMNTDSLMNISSERLKGKTVTLLVNANNEVVDVQGFDQFLENENLDATTQLQVKKMFSKEQMNSMFGMMFQLYPEKPVRVGESWDKNISTSIADIKMTMKGKYKLKAVSNDIATIDIVGDFSGKGKMSQGQMDMNMDLKGSQDGQMNVGLKDGYLKDADYKLDMKGEMNAMGQKVPMEIKGKYMIKGK